jgi:hypothetical protein
MPASSIICFTISRLRSFLRLKPAFGAMHLRGLAWPVVDIPMALIRHWPEFANVLIWQEMTFAGILIATIVVVVMLALLWLIFRNSDSN